MTKSSTTTRARSADRATGPPEGVATIHTVEQLGPNMSRLANGSLLCRNVPIGRVGWMMYGRGETPVVPADNSPVAYVQRTADELFSADTMGSFVGAAVVDEHPEDDVTPLNWRGLARGHAQNVRPGTGDDADILLADLVITDAELIKSVLAGKREVSLGYDADYHQTAPGVGMQTRILGNHIALVEKGRCGPRCAIGDREFQTQPTEKENDMKTNRVRITPRTRQTTADRAALELARQKVADAEAELLEAEGAADDLDDDGHTHIHVHTGGVPGDKKGADDPYEERFAAIELGQTQLSEGVRQILAAIGKKSRTDDGSDDETAEEKAARLKAEAEADDEPGDRTKTGDSVALETSFKDTIAQAEILVPGFRAPTFDAAMPRAKTVDAMCRLRRRALDACMATEDGAKLVTGISGSADLDVSEMGCKDVALVFRAAALAKGGANNQAATRDSTKITAAGAAERKGPPSPAELNAIHEDFWKDRTPRG